MRVSSVGAGVGVSSVGAGVGVSSVGASVSVVGAVVGLGVGSGGARDIILRDK